jgi:signal peptidase I
MQDAPSENDPLVAPRKAATKKKRSEWADFSLFLLKLGIAVFIFRSFIFAPFSIPSESMVPKLLVGDYLFVSKWSYGYSRNSLPFRLPLIPGRLFGSTPERGDVAVFKEPPTLNIDYIKRVIGIAGDRVQMRNGQIILNGVPVPKKRIGDYVLPLTAPGQTCFPNQATETASDGSQRCRYARFVETLPNGKSYEVLDTLGIDKDNTEEIVVPQGYLLMMGDNRDNSKDSRFSVEYDGGIGLVPEENLVGKASRIVFSTDGTASIFKPWTWFGAARPDRIGTGF